jgi:DNA (cytosine-5)-methyltransferase 1
MPMRVIHLFAGAGGGILADAIMGHQCICAVEIDPYCQQVLSARQVDGYLPWFPIYRDVTKFDGKPWRGLADIVAGGFPCQDVSSAGSGRGLEGSHSGLWREMARIIGEVQPRYAFLENSPLLTGRGLGRVLGDLAEMGYHATWGVLGASRVGAVHRRERIWIRAEFSNSNGSR